MRCSCMTGIYNKKEVTGLASQAGKHASELLVSQPPVTSQNSTH